MHFDVICRSCSKTSDSYMLAIPSRCPNCGSKHITVIRQPEGVDITSLLKEDTLGSL